MVLWNLLSWVAGDVMDFDLWLKTSDDKCILYAANTNLELPLVTVV